MKKSFKKYPRYYDRGATHIARIYRVTVRGAPPEYYNSGTPWDQSYDYGTEQKLRNQLRNRHAKMTQISEKCAFKLILHEN